MTMRIMRSVWVALVLAAAFMGIGAGVAGAQEVRITPDVAFYDIVIGGRTIRIERNQDQDARLSNDFTKTSRPCPPFCIHPMSAAEGVETVGEIELLDFLKNSVETGDGLLIDARIPVWYQKGTIPGSINVPFNVFSPEDNPYLDQILAALGGVKRGDQWNFSNAKTLLLFCNGAWCDQSPTAIRNLISVGYPPDKLLYYRGGMQAWQSMGLTVRRPQ